MSTFLVINKHLYKIYVVKLTAELPTTDSLTVWQCSLSAAASGTNTESFQRVCLPKNDRFVSPCVYWDLQTFPWSPEEHHERAVYTRMFSVVESLLLNKGTKQFQTIPGYLWYTAKLRLRRKMNIPVHWRLVKYYSRSVVDT